jgi:hypothetical protein
MLMNFIRRLVFAAAAVSALASAPAVFAQRLLGNSFGGTLYDVDVATGALSNPRPVGTGGESLMGISFGPGYQLHGLTTFVGTPPNALVFINDGTGAATTIGATGFSTLAEGDLAFDLSTGVLYGIQNIGTDSRELITINPLTGAATVVGSLGVNASGDYSAMAFGPGGSLYVLDTGLDPGGSRLLTVDKATAASRDHQLRRAVAGLGFYGGHGLQYGDGHAVCRGWRHAGRRARAVHAQSHDGRCHFDWFP